jgi:hypothetical protein
LDGRDDLDDQIGSEFEIGGLVGIGRDAVGPDEGHVRAEYGVGVALEPKARLRDDDAEAGLVGEPGERRPETQRRPAVDEAGRRRPDDHPPQQLVVLPVFARCQEIVNGGNHGNNHGASPTASLTVAMSVARRHRQQAALQGIHVGQQMGC